MDAFDETIQKAKDIFDTACKKTEEVVNVQKLRLDLSSVENRLNKSYATLGRLQFVKIKDEESSDPEISTVVQDIKEKISEIEELRAKITELTGKINCPSCGATLPSNASFCSRCGSKVKEDN